MVWFHVTRTSFSCYFYEENVQESSRVSFLLYSRFDEWFELMQVESAIAAKLVSGGCSYDMMKVM